MTIEVVVKCSNNLLDPSNDILCLPNGWTSEQIAGIDCSVKRNLSSNRQADCVKCLSALLTGANTESGWRIFLVAIRSISAQTSASVKFRFDKEGILGHLSTNGINISSFISEFKAEHTIDFVGDGYRIAWIRIEVSEGSGLITPMLPWIMDALPESFMIAYNPESSPDLVNKDLILERVRYYHKPVDWTEFGSIMTTTVARNCGVLFRRHGAFDDPETGITAMARARALIGLFPHVCGLDSQKMGEH